jgi:hypothetical protein
MKKNPEPLSLSNKQLPEIFAAQGLVAGLLRPISAGSRKGIRVGQH